VTTLYQAHALGLIRLAVVMLGDRPAAEDVVQEAFCGLYRRWHSLADTGKALAYVRSSVSTAAERSCAAAYGNGVWILWQEISPANPPRRSR